MKKIILVVWLFFIATLAYAGDIAEPKLSDISLGMKSEQIISILGEPNLTRSEGLNTEGKSVQRMEYSVTKRIDLSKEDNDTGQREMTYICSLMLVDGVLVRIDRQR